jgi:hypothetical protein
MEEVRANRTSRLERSSEDKAQLEKRQEWEKCVAQCVQERPDPKDELVCARICV